MKKQDLMFLLRNEEFTYEDMQYTQIYFAFMDLGLEPDVRTIEHIIEEYKTYSGDMSLEDIAYGLANRIAEGELKESIILKQGIKALVSECYK